MPYKRGSCRECGKDVAIYPRSGGAALHTEDTTQRPCAGSFMVVTVEVPEGQLTLDLGSEEE